MSLIQKFYCALEPIMLYLMEDCFGGPKIFKVKTAVNLQVVKLLFSKITERRNYYLCALADADFPEYFSSTRVVHIL